MTSETQDVHALEPLACMPRPLLACCMARPIEKGQGAQEALRVRAGPILSTRLTRFGHVGHDIPDNSLDAKRGVPTRRSHDLVAY